MIRKRLNAEQFATKLHHTEVLQGQGNTIAVACKEAGMNNSEFSIQVVGAVSAALQT